MTVWKHKKQLASFGCQLKVLCQYAAGAIIMFSPIAAVQVGIGNGGTGIRRMNKLTISCVDTHMRDAIPGAGTCKKDDITSTQIALGNGSAHIELLSRGAVRGIAQLLQNIINKSRAIKSRRGGSSGDIGTAEIALCFCKDLRAGDIYGGSRGRICGSGRNSANGLATAEILRGIGRLLVFVRIFCEFQIVAADIAGGVIMDDFIPTFI